MKLYSKRFHIVLYPERFLCLIDVLLQKQRLIKKYAYIFHCETGVKPHYHLYLDFGRSGVSRDYVAHYFCIEPYLIEQCTAPLSSLFRYFLSNGKSSYNPSDIVANFDIMPYLNGSEE